MCGHQHHHSSEKKCCGGKNESCKGCQNCGPRQQGTKTTNVLHRLIDNIFAKD